MRDFYDIHMLFLIYRENIDKDILHEAYVATCEQRGTLHILASEEKILNTISESNELKVLWRKYTTKYAYASGIDYCDVMCSINEVVKMAVKTAS